MYGCLELRREKRERQVYCDMLGDGIPEIAALKNDSQAARLKGVIPG